MNSTSNGMKRNKSVDMYSEPMAGSPPATADVRAPGEHPAVSCKLCVRLSGRGFYQIWIEAKELIMAKFEEEERRCHFNYDGSSPDMMPTGARL